MNFNKAQEILLKNEKYAQAYDNLDMPFEIATMVIHGRTKRDMTQDELAKLVGTGQSSIARLESGDSLPSLGFLKKISDALGMVLLPPLFIPKEEISYKASSLASNLQFKAKLMESRRSLISNPSDIWNSYKVQSGNSETTFNAS